jgi:hypothetical protein
MSTRVIQNGISGFTHQEAKGLLDAMTEPRLWLIGPEHFSRKHGPAAYYGQPR